MRDGAVLPALQKVVAEGVHPVAMSNTRITDEWASRDGKVEVKSHGHEVGFPWYGQVWRRRYHPRELHHLSARARQEFGNAPRTPRCNRSLLCRKKTLKENVIRMGGHDTGQAVLDTFGPSALHEFCPQCIEGRPKRLEEGRGVVWQGLWKQVAKLSGAVLSMLGSRSRRKFSVVGLDNILRLVTTRIRYTYYNTT